MVEDALNPLPSLFPIGHVRQDRGVFDRDRNLIVETVVDPALDLFACAETVVHRDVKGVVDVVAAFLRAQLLLEFLFGPGRWVAHGCVTT